MATMNCEVSVEHTSLNIGQLCERVRSPSAPIRRSAHIGNQPPHELLLMTAAPAGIEMILVDTIQGNDSYYPQSPPKMIRLDERESIPLCRRKSAIGKVVGSIVVDESCLPKHVELVCTPQPGESLVAFHTRAIDMLEPSNRPVIMTDFFARHADLFRAIMQVAQQFGEVTRIVRPNGLIETVAGLDPVRDGILGLEDVSPRSEGTMIPLNGMMALDMAISTANGSDETTHLGGRHMIDYTRDDRRMYNVSKILAKTLAEAGLSRPKHCYEVVDITGLARLVSDQTHASQHQLLRKHGAVQIDLADHPEEPCGQG